MQGIGDDGDQPQADRIARRKGVTPIAGTGPNGETDFNAFPNLSVGSYPVVLYLCGMEIENSGLNYTSTDQIVISPNDAGAEVRPTFGPWGVLTKVEIINGGSGWTERPNIYIRSQTGYNAVIVPRFCIQRVSCLHYRYFDACTRHASIRLVPSHFLHLRFHCLGCSRHSSFHSVQYHFQKSKCARQTTGEKCV